MDSFDNLGFLENQKEKYTVRSSSVYTDVITRLGDCVLIEKSLIFLHVIPDLIRDPGFYLSEIMLDSGSEPGMTE